MIKEYSIDDIVRKGTLNKVDFGFSTTQIRSMFGAEEHMEDYGDTCFLHFGALRFKFLQSSLIEVRFDFFSTNSFALKSKNNKLKKVNSKTKLHKFIRYLMDEGIAWEKSSFVDHDNFTIIIENVYVVFRLDNGALNFVSLLEK